MNAKPLKVILTALGTIVCAAALSALMASSLTGCSDSGDTIKIATKPMTEQFILGEMMAAVIENDTRLKVRLTPGVGGGTAHIHPAMVRGEFDVYPEYTGTAWAYVLKKQNLPNATMPQDDALLEEMSHEYLDRYKLTWLGMYGFNNSYGLAVRKDLADRLNLKNYSDLAPIAGQLRFGAEYDFYEREDGYNALCKAYGLEFADHRDMDIGLKYRAIAENEVDVINVFTTDGQLSEGTVTVLRDDKNFYPTYYCGTVARMETLNRHPELRLALMKLNNILDDAEMARLNYEVDVEKRSPKEVAHEYLVQKNCWPSEKRA